MAVPIGSDRGFEVLRSHIMRLHGRSPVTEMIGLGQGGHRASEPRVDRVWRRIQNAAVASSDRGTNLDLELRPSRKPGWLRAIPKASVTLLGLFGLGLVLVWIKRPTVVGFVALVGLGGIVASLVVAVVGLWLYRRNERIFVRGTQVGQVDMWGRKRVWSIDLIEKAVSGLVKMSSDGTSLIPDVQVALLVDRNGASMMSLSPSVWDPTDLERLWQRLGIDPVPGWTEPLLPEDLRRRYPGAVREIPSSSMSPGKSALVIGGSLVLAVVLSICLLR